MRRDRGKQTLVAVVVVVVEVSLLLILLIFMCNVLLVYDNTKDSIVTTLK